MDYNQLVADLSNLIRQFKLELIQFLPNFLMALLIFLIGYLLAKLVKTGIIRLVKKLPDFVPNEKMRFRIKALHPERSARLFGTILFWIVFFFFLTAATEILGLPILTAWLSGLVRYLPNILAAVLIGFLGYMGGIMARDLITTATATAGITYGKVLGKLAQYTLFLITILIGVEQIGVEIAVLTTLIYIVIGALLLGASLAFGLGARTSVSNILAAYYFQGRYQKGNIVKIGDLEGEIIQITPTTVIIKTENGEATIPAKTFNEMISILTKQQA